MTITRPRPLQVGGHLGAARLRAYDKNNEWLESVFLGEHYYSAAGLYGAAGHSTPRVASAVGAVSVLVGGTTTATSDTDDTRKCIIASCNTSDVASKPHVVSVINTASNFTLRCSSLSSSLGAGNTWAAVARSCGYAKFSSQQSNSPPRTSRGAVENGPLKWSEANRLITNQRSVLHAFEQQHDSQGGHVLAGVARAVHGVTWNGSAYAHTRLGGSTGCSISSASRTGAGIYVVNFTGLPSGTSFCKEMGVSSDVTQPVVVNSYETASNQLTFYIYAFDGANWARADRSFFFALYRF